MPASTKHSAVSDFICACEIQMRAACEGLAFYKEYEGKNYCVLHYPSKEKEKDFKIALQKKLKAKDFNFHGVWFPSLTDFTEYKFTDDANFISATFAADVYFVYTIFGADANFTLATFNATAYFSHATFNAADFSSTTFIAVDFISATFGAYAHFISAIFKGDADFTSATFNAETSFRSATFLKTVLFVKTIYKKESVTFFPLARFSYVMKFQDCNFESQLPFNLDEAIFEKPEWVIFHTIALQPRWFINVDPRKFNFINVRWGELNRKAIDSELRAIQGREFSTPHRLLTIAYRQLAVNAEDNNRYGEAADFRHAAMRTRSLEIRQDFRRSLSPPESLKHSKVLRFWHHPIRRLREAWQALDPLHSLYGFVSGYGESVGRATLILITVWLAFAVGYWLGDRTWWQQKADRYSVIQTTSVQTQAPPVPETLSFRDAIIYSGGVLTLQKPEPLPANKRAKAMVMLETILGPLQAALLALAIRRKFMR